MQVYLEPCTPPPWKAMLGAALSFLLVAGCSRGDGVEAPVPRTVLIHTVSSAPPAAARISGELRAADRSDLAFEVGGPITSMTVDLGDEFELGDVLAEVDDRQPRLDLAARRANLIDAEATLADARLDYERRAALAGTGAVSQSAIDRAKARLDSAKAQVDALRAEVGRAEERLADTRLVAPFSGEVAARLAEPSEVVAAGRAVLRVIGDPSAVEALVNVPAGIRDGLERGRRAEILAPSRDLTAEGTITEIGAEANAAGLFPITVAVSDAASALRPGESVEARFPPSESSERLLVPLTAYVPAAGRTATVFVVEGSDGDERAVARRVTLGALRDDGVEVVEGLRPGDRIVAKGADLLTDGERIRTAGDGPARYNQ